MARARAKPRPASETVTVAGVESPVKVTVLKAVTLTFSPIQAGLRDWDIRVAKDRDFHVGDLIRYVEIDKDGKPTGREMMKKIVYLISRPDEMKFWYHLCPPHLRGIANGCVAFTIKDAS